MIAFTHHTARSVDEAVDLLGRYEGKARLNAGGTDLLGVLQDEILPEAPRAVVDIKRIPGLDILQEAAGSLRVGALVTLDRIARSPLVTDRYPVLAEAARSVATPQIRNVGTLGGNLCQDVRCWYYRYPAHVGGPVGCARKGNGPCLAVKGDNRYHAILDAKGCIAACPSDTAVALAALDAEIAVIGPEGERAVAPTDFYAPLKNALTPGEMVRGVRIPARPKPTQQTFLKFTLRKPVDFAIVSVACVLTVEDGTCTDARVVLGAVAPGPVRAAAAEEVLVGGAITAKQAGKAAEAALTGAKPFAKNSYKVDIAKALVRRAILGERD